METSWKEYILMFFDKQLLSIAPEIGHLAPVILTMGTAFIALITLNYPLGILAASSIEAHLLYNVIKVLGDYFVTPLVGVSNPTAGENQCRSYFQMMTPSRFTWFMEQGAKTVFPNQSLYWLSFVSAYMIQSMTFFKEEMEQLGPQYSNRPYIALIAACMLIALYSIYLLVYGCNSVLTVIVSIAIGLGVGLLISSQNYFLLDKPGVNVLFIPTLAKRTGMDYVCVSTSSN